MLCSHCYELWQIFCKKQNDKYFINDIWMIENERESHRIATNIEIKFREKGSFVRSYMLNVNNGGLFLKTDKPLAIDAEVTMRIQLPDDQETMTIEGRVVWTNQKSKVFPAGMGLQFTKILPEHQEKIKIFVDAHRKEIKSLAMM
jgi:type IV pilus assembly protein PilZ